MSPRNLIWGIACCWLAVEAVYIGYSYTRSSLRGGGITADDLIVNAVHWAVIVLMSAVVIAHSRLQEAGLARIALLIVAGTLLLAVVKTVLNDALDQGVNRGWNRLAVEFHPALADVFITFGAAYALIVYDAKRKLQLSESQLSRDLATSELARLRAQLQPQFLFGMLDAISNRVATRPADAQRMIGRLGELLRMAIPADAAQTDTTVNAELAFLRAYLDLQRMRLGDRLEIHIEVDDDARPATMPALLLQSLIEHALHDTTELRIAIRRREDMVQIAISSSGAVDADVPGVRARLERIYGHRARLTVTSGHSIEVEFPAHTNAQHSGDYA